MRRNQDGALQLEAAMLTFVEKECWSVIGGEGSGSLITLAFGGKQRRPKQLTNKNLTELQQSFEGECELYLACAWRLESETDVICTSTSSNRRNGTMMRTVHELVGRRVLAVAVTYPAGDLHLAFDDGISLKAFADQANELDDYCNYTVSANSQVVINGSRSKLSGYQRAQAE